MKYVALLFSLMYGLNGYSQTPNPDLFQTWYLSELIGDFSPSFNVQEIVPSITPSLTISSDLNFTGTGACNTFTGSFANASSEIFETAQLSATELICSTPVHNALEMSYFNFLQATLQYQIIPREEGLVMVLYHPLMAQAVFQNYMLKTNAFEADQITIYPNPTTANLFLNCKHLVVSEIQVVNAIGQNVMTVDHDFVSINIAELSTGIYMLQIKSDLGTFNKKIVKE